MYVCVRDPPASLRLERVCVCTGEVNRAVSRPTFGALVHTVGECDKDGRTLSYSASGHRSRPEKQWTSGVLRRVRASGNFVSPGP